MEDDENTLKKFTGKIALVTGGSRGIGKAIAIAFAKKGAIVVINDIDIDMAKETAEKIESFGGRTFIVKADVSKRVEVNQMAEKVLEKFGRLDVLVNNAGICTICPAEKFSEADWDRELGIDLKGVFLCSQAFGKSMIKQNQGNIINIASMAGKTALPGHIAYCTAKAGVIAMTKVLAIEWAKYNIRINAIAPGFVKTELVSDMIEKGLRKKEEQDAIERRIPQRRLASTEEIGDLAVYLASEESRYMTGETVVIDGGWLAYGYI